MNSTCAHQPVSQVNHFESSSSAQVIITPQPAEELLHGPATVTVKQSVSAAHPGKIEFYGKRFDAVLYSGCAQMSFDPEEEVLMVGRLKHAPHIWLIAPLNFTPSSNDAVPF